MRYKDMPEKLKKVAYNLTGFIIENTYDEDEAGEESDRAVAEAYELGKRDATPFGVDWPCFEDGGLVGFGDVVEDHAGDPARVTRVSFAADGETTICCEGDGRSSSLRVPDCGDVKRPSVVCGDGETAKVGDTVRYSGSEYTIADWRFDVDGALRAYLSKDGKTDKFVPVRWLAICKPDSWRKWGSDLEAAVASGEVDTVEMMRRAKKLAKEES